MMAHRIARLSRMSAAEVQWRVGTVVRNTMHRARARLHPPQWDRHALVTVLAGPAAEQARRDAGAGRWMDAHKRLAESILEPPSRFLIAPMMRETMAARIIADFPAAPRDAAARAEKIVSGEYNLLGYRGLRFDALDGTTPDWHLDPVHRQRAPQLFWASVPFLDQSCGDHKIIWELNRHQHFLSLGRAYWLTGDERFRAEAIRQIGSWIQQNPPLTGINWASMLELGFRSISWLWAMHFFTNDPAADSEPWLVDTFIALDRQLRHVEQNLSYYFSPNTHLLGEALALYVCGRSLPQLAAAGRYAATGRRVLIDQIARQIGQDGGHLERSTHYHRYTLDFYLLAAMVARITGDTAVSTFDAAVARLAFAARLLSDSRARFPHIGDDDGGMLFPICGRAADDIRDTLAEASALVERPDLRVGDAPEEAQWLMAHPRVHPLLDAFRTVPQADALGSAALPDTGYYVSRSAAGDHLVIDAGQHGYENGGHAHADALSMTLSVRGVPLLIDPGTGAYTTSPEIRDAFRSSMLHNTVVVDSRSQSVPSGPFHWAQTAHARAEAWRTNPGFDYLEAWHDGYAPLEQRRFVLALHGDLLVVADLVEGEGTHDVQVNWHFDPRWSVDVAGRRALLRSAGERVEVAVSRGSLDLVRGTEGSGIGWHAPVYGRIEPTSTLVVSDSGNTPLWAVTVFGMNPANEVLTVEQIPVWAHAGVLARGVGVRIARTHSVDLFGLAAPAVPASGGGSARTGQTWRFAGYETDARMLFCRATDSVSRLALVDGSIVRSADRYALNVQLPREAPDLHLDFSRRRGTQPVAARVGGQAFGAQVQFGGRELPIAVERRALARATARRTLAH